ncbi:hypothetical protein JEZ23_21085 [Pseudomonas aeruginosa]|nr:hypothetical protein [Pseudomonas aeruginosa]HCF3403494.1 hypothetical protein [Pseudomonas aeruginosa]HCF5748784.1 hypothetical protein [Pseudomonas aeruginosa]
MAPSLNCYPGVVMANQPELHRHLKAAMAIGPASAPVNLSRVRDFVSSPRLFDVYVKGPASAGMAPAGDTFLDMHTLLADKTPKTYALSLTTWQTCRNNLAVVQEFSPHDGGIICVQVWPFEIETLDHFQTVIAVAMSYTRAELEAESRISSALDELVEEYGFFADEF